MNKKKIVAFILFFGIYFVIQFLLGWAMKGNMYNSFGRATLHDLHTAEKIENLMLGDSHLYAGLDVNTLSELNNTTFLTAATASQEVDGHLVILKETFKYHPELKRVFIDVDYLNNFQGDFKDRNHLRNIYTISDNLKDKKLKVNYLLKATSPKYYLNHILIFGKNRISGNPKDIIYTVKSLLTGEYWKYKKPVSGNQSYAGNGFIPCSTVPTDTIVKASEQIYFDKSGVSKDWYKFMQKIFEFCNKNNIELCFIAVPESKFKIWDTINYTEYYNFINSYVTSNGFTYYDFNLSNNLELFREDFYDDEHLNYPGAVKFTKCFNEFLNTEALQRGNLFYTSLENKKLSEPNTIAGFVTELSDDGKSITFKPVTNNENNIIEYTYKTEVNNTTNIVAEKTLVNSINLPLGSEGKINIQINLNNEYFCTFDYQFNTLWIK